MVTQEEIARIVGVSKSTVSKALRGGSDISAETARMIAEVAARSGYRVKARPNGDAEAGERMIGVLCPETRSDYYNQIATQLTNKLRENNYFTVFAYSDFDYAQEVRLINLFMERDMAGVICITEFEQISAYIKTLASKYRVPVLHIGINVMGTDLDSICVNEEKCLSIAVSHLLELGHRRVAFIGDRFSDVRREYFEKAMDKCALPGLERRVLIDPAARHADCGYKLMGELLKRGGRPTAVVAAYDNIALGAMRRISDEGLCVPGDFSVTGCDNSDYTPYLPIGLTTIDGHIKEMCDIAVSILKRKMNDEGYRTFQNVQIVPELLIRESTGPVK